MRVWIDTVSGTWGTSEVVTVDVTDAEMTALDGMSDSEVSDFGLTRGIPINSVEALNRLT